MTRRIRVMDAALSAQIAAGEVIERPASIVKELIDNALDAGARHLRIDTENGGMGLIRVADDGEGILPEDLVLAFSAHATSKLDSFASLGSLETLGFRGEALHAIAAVSRVEAVSSVVDAAAGARVVIERGQLQCHEPAPPVRGTRIAVFNLFADVPARRKYLRSARSEGSAIHATVSQYALGYPSVAFSLQVDGRPSFLAPGTGSLRDAFAAAYGADLLNRVLEVRQDGRVAAGGLVSAPQLSRGNRSAILFYINGRPVRSSMLTYALEDAYRGQLMAGRHPLAVVHLQVPPDEVDPNVHPAKAEVRFLRERDVFAAVRAAVGQALGPTVPMPIASFGRPDSGVMPGVPAGVGPRPFPFEAMGDSAALDPDSEEPPVSAGTANPAADLASGSYAGPNPSTEETGSGRPPPDTVAAPAGEDGTPGTRRVAPPVTQALPLLRVFGQSAATFIIAEGPEGLYMIDQHAAHERILFDQLVAARVTAPTQALLEPLAVSLSAQQVEALEAHGALLAELGFDVEPFGDCSCLVRALPVATRGACSPDVVLDVLDALSGEQNGPSFRDRALTVVACKAAVKAGQTLSLYEMRELVAQLEQTARPRTCPHGRPTMVHLSTHQLEREFGRK